MAYSETTTVGYGKRLSGSLKGILIGFLLLIVGTVLLWWNEGRAVKTARSIKGAYEQTIKETPDLSAVNAELNGKMICAPGLATTNDVVSDPFFGISANAIRIERKVEFYQFVQKSETKTEDKVGGKQEQTTTYTYSEEWVSSPVNSNDFKDSNYKGKNTVVMNNIRSDKMQAQNVTVGAYTLPQSMVSSISGGKPMSVSLSAEKLSELNNTVAQALGQSDGQFVTVSGNQIYLGKNPNSPAIGDIKITFTQVDPTDVTIWAKVSGSTFEKFVASNDYSVGGLYMGTKTLDQLKEQSESANSVLTWLFRLVGLVIVFFGYKGVFDIVVTLLKVLPFLAKIANVGVSIVCGVLGLAWSLIIIAIAWLFYRPILAIILIAIVVGLFVFLSKRSKDAPVPAEQA
ncbi:MAG: TMEM43 family protein [Salinivirgaceae bacterium]|nr:TMEM43 family protein [Salinivirgaceae bacterium]